MTFDPRAASSGDVAGDGRAGSEGAGGDIPGAGRFLTLGDVGEVLNLTASQAYELVRSGELPAIKIGGSGQWRIERDVLEGYIAGKYEENRRRNLWNQADYADGPELFADRDR